ncbi:MAG TPA: LTA synthase family protein [Thermoanaerobaculia bacterium]|jgi:phosphoglycerol transferase MdoB-like AlkP superfamily enzyme|nr:LTA synthase family protein [Thermoanaerobaculia bacterium]
MPTSSPAPWFGLRVANRFRFAFVWIAFLWSLFLITRLVLLGVQHVPTQNGLGVALASLGSGALLDLLAALWVALPLMLYLTLVPERWFARRWQRILLQVGLFLAIFGALFVSVIELFFFLEFNGRFNFVAVDYLMFPTEVADNVWQSYPTGKIVAALLVVTIGLLAALRRPIAKAWADPTAMRRRLPGFGIYLAVVLALTFGLPSGLAEVSADRAVNQIAENGYLCFAAALAGSNASYEGLYATRPDAQVYPRLRRLLTEPATTPGTFASKSTLRAVRGLAPSRPWNVVVVLEESLGSEFIGALHPRPVSLTPRFDALTAEGTLLTHAYSTGNRTIRAIEATTSSLPPLPGISVVRRPASKNLFTLPGLLRERGYQTLWVYGGRALFDGMGSYLTNNGVDRIFEQKDYPAGTFTTAWGAADQSIFDQALLQMDGFESAGKPFYTLILSVSNHRPYTFPDGPIRPDPKLKRRENVVRYADWALGRFIEQAKGHAFFDHTLFVLLGDHGARVYGAEAIPLPSYEVPILFLAPGLVPAGQRIDTLASSLDLPPTILSLLGISYESRFFGHDVFHIAPDQGRALMTHNNEIALMRGGRIAVLGLQGRTSLFSVGAEDQFVPIPRPDRQGHELVEDAIAYYDGADELYRTGRYLLPTLPDRLVEAKK